MALNEVVGQLRPHRKYIEPTVRNLDTGETYSAHEVGAKVPKALSPRHLEPLPSGNGSRWLSWADSRRLEVGQAVCEPVLPLIPASVTPNTITLVNHGCNWLLLAAGCSARSFPQHTVSLLVLAAVLNFLCMMMDCLDGMHARRTGQTSKLGELLDHYLDAIHTPMVTGTAAVALNLPLWGVITSCVLGAAVYNSQLLHFHYSRVFVETAGVEGQIGTSFLILAAAYVHTLPEAHAAHYLLPNAISLASLLVMSKLVLFFVVRYDNDVLLKFVQFMLLQVVPSFLHICGFIGEFPFVLVLCFVSFRITGSYVLHSIVYRPYSGMDQDIVYWMLAWFYSHVAMLQLPMNVFYTRLVPYTGDFFYGASLQDMLPYALCVHIAVKNVIDVSRELSRLKRM